jgi:hypothetical protein
MSKIALTPDASGTGTFTIAAPNSNTDRTLTLPDATGTVNVSGLANEVPAGSAGAPAIYPTGDTNTGIFFPAADTIAFSEGGVEAMRIDSSGRLGIGTTSPTFKLDVNGDVKFPQRRRGFIYAAGVSAGTTGTYNIDATGFLDEGQGGGAVASRAYFYVVHSAAGNHHVVGVGLYSNNFNGNALLLATISAVTVAGGSISFGINGAKPRATITNSSGFTPDYWAEIVFLN